MRICAEVNVTHLVRIRTHLASFYCRIANRHTTYTGAGRNVKMSRKHFFFKFQKIINNKTKFMLQKCFSFYLISFVIVGDYDSPQLPLLIP